MQKIIALCLVAHFICCDTDPWSKYMYEHTSVYKLDIFKAMTLTVILHFKYLTFFVNAIDT